jgi:MarR family transcriptional regulator, 2-MHQ and catechol-resistance regulon repressor
MNHPPTPTGMHVWLVLWKAYRAMESVDKRSIASLGLGGISDFALLEVVLHKGPTPINEIGRKVGLTSGSITAAVDRAQTRGWIVRIPDSIDRRVIRIDLTGEGRRVIEQSLRHHAETLEDAASILDPDERSTLITLLKKLGRHAHALNETTRVSKPASHS